MNISIDSSAFFARCVQFYRCISILDDCFAAMLRLSVYIGDHEKLQFIKPFWDLIDAYLSSLCSNWIAMRTNIAAQSPNSMYAIRGKKPMVVNKVYSINLMTPLHYLQPTVRSLDHHHHHADFLSLWILKCLLLGEWQKLIKTNAV